jgi:ammonia channel protein AmtB
MGAVSVHLVGGWWGVAAVGFFAHPDYMHQLHEGHLSGVIRWGLLYGGGSDLLLRQLVIAAAITVWAGLLSGLVLLVLPRLFRFNLKSSFFETWEEAYERDKMDHLKRILKATIENSESAGRQESEMPVHTI